MEKGTKSGILDEKNRCAAFVRLVLCLFGFWSAHLFFRVSLLFSPDSFGFPFSGSPFRELLYASSADFIWLFGCAAPFATIAWFFGRRKRLMMATFGVYAAFQSILLVVAGADGESIRLTGTHLGSFDAFFAIAVHCRRFAFAFVFPCLLFAVFAFVRRFSGSGMPIRRATAALCTVSFLAVSLLSQKMPLVEPDRAWELSPAISACYRQWRNYSQARSVDWRTLFACVRTSRKFWNRIEGPSASRWEYPDSAYPLYRIPRKGAIADSASLERRSKRPNIVVVFLKGARGSETGYLNPDDFRESVTPVLDSLASAGIAWTRMYASGMPGASAVISSHIGIPMHRSRRFTMDPSIVDAPSFASALRDSGYASAAFLTPDFNGNRLFPWLRKWYGRVFSGARPENDSSFFRDAASFICDSLARKGVPFLATMISPNSPHPTRDGMRLADAGLGGFLERISRESWFKNTYLIVTADLGFSLPFRVVSARGRPDLTWIPFVIVGPGLDGTLRDVAASQIDMAPTALSLAGIRTANSFLGHDLLRVDAEAHPFSLGVYENTEAISADGYRVLSDLPECPSAGGDAIFSDEDVFEEQSLMATDPDEALRLRALADSILVVNDYVLSADLLRKRR